MTRSIRLRFERLFDGEVPSATFGFLRLGLASIFLVRHADWFRPWVALEHHQSVHGLLFYESAPLAPALRSPWWLGVSLGTPTTRALIVLRTLLSVALLLGVRARLSAALLGGVSLSLLAADRFRYYHHLYLLYVAILWLALAPIGDRFTLVGALRWFRARIGRQRPSSPASVPESSPAWPLQFIRALVLSVYAAAGSSKLDVAWLRGDALRELEFVRVLDGPMWGFARDVVGYSGVAWCACCFELGVCVLLCLRLTRRVAVLAALGFHLGISLCMPVYSFGAQMAVLLVAFLVVRKVAEPSIA